MKAVRSLFRLTPLALACAGFAAAAAAADSKIDPQLAGALAAGGQAEAMIELTDRADALLLDPAADVVDRRTAWMTMLRLTAERSQADLVAWLRARGVEHRAYWINNTVWLRADAATLAAVAQRAEVAHVYANAPFAQRLPQPEPGPRPETTLAIEWGVNKIRAPDVWTAGFTGQGVVVAGQDTGIRWDHAALKAKYRGWDGATADHNYNWHDGVHTGGSTGCLANSTVPCDDHNHGTHTMGTMVGDDGAANQVGVAPGARWIGCRNMDAGNGTPATYTDCMQWLLAPTDLAGANADPSKAPDIINNSWGCPTSEGCTPTNILQSAVENLVNAGIFFVASAANDGPGCNTITAPPAIYDASFVVGSTTSGDAMSGFSSRGPVPGLTTNKPDVSAPGSSVRSSLRNGSYGNMSGTSMAGPHVAGAAALLVSAFPTYLRGRPDRIGRLLQETAVPIADVQSCGGIAATTFPNPVQGYGRIDVYAAYQRLATDPLFDDDFEL